MFLNGWGLCSPQWLREALFLRRILWILIPGVYPTQDMRIDAFPHFNFLSRSHLIGAGDFHFELESIFSKLEAFFNGQDFKYSALDYFLNRLQSRISIKKFVFYGPKTHITGFKMDMNWAYIFWYIFWGCWEIPGPTNELL